MIKFNYHLLKLVGLLSIAIILSLDSRAQTLSLDKNQILHKLEHTQDGIWAVDYGSGFVLKSEDKGKTWEISSELGSEYFEQIQFVSPSIGFVCGDYGYVYKTSDAGKSWQEISPEIEGRITERYRNDSTKNQKPDGQFVAYYDMFFKDSLNGFVSGFKMNPGKGSFGQLFFITKNGGSSWEETKRDESSFSPFYQNVFVHKRFYLNELEIWAVQKTENEYLIKRSEDGGATWSSSQLPNYQPEGKWMIRKILFKDSDNGFVFGGTLDEKEEALVFYTKDGGETWLQYHVEWPHIHDAILVEDKLFLSGKAGFFEVIDQSVFGQ